MDLHKLPSPERQRVGLCGFPSGELGKQKTHSLALGARLAKPGFLAAFLAAMLLGELAAARMLLSADRERVTIAGMPVDAACAFKQRFGVPCPACGMSRSFVLTLHGDLATALDLNPGGPMLVLGILYFSGAMLWLSFRQRLRSRPNLSRTVRRIQWSTAAVGVSLMAVVCVHWIRVL